MSVIPQERRLAHGRPQPQASARPRVLRQLTTFLYRASADCRWRCCCGPPLLWLGVVYLGSLLALLIQSFYHLDDFTGTVPRQFTLATYRDLLYAAANLDIVARTAAWPRP